MLFKCENINSRPLKRIVEHILYLLLMFVLIPGFLYFEICIVLPAVEEKWIINLVHMPMAFFLLINIVGNMLFGMLTDSSIKGKFLSKNNKTDWSLCTVCESLKPPRAWHCDICNICVLKRDHHCTFLTSCVGYYNFRYFLLFTLHVFIAMIYAFCYNVKFFATFITWNHGLALLKFILPILNFVVDSGAESLYILMFVINILFTCFSGYLLYFHMENVLNGQITPERKLKSKEYNKGWRKNLVEVFGSKWYLTWVLPFIPSPLPGDGTHWDEEDKYK